MVESIGHRPDFKRGSVMKKQKYAHFVDVAGHGESIVKLYEDGMRAPVGFLFYGFIYK